MPLAAANKAIDSHALWHFVLTHEAGRLDKQPEVTFVVDKTRGRITCQALRSTRYMQKAHIVWRKKDILAQAITMDSVTFPEYDSGCYTRSRHTLIDR